jgi:hypothetical protein
LCAPIPDDIDITIDRRRFTGPWTNGWKTSSYLDEMTVDSSRVDPWGLPELAYRPPTA